MVVAGAGVDDGGGDVGGGGDGVDGEGVNRMSSSGSGFFWDPRSVLPVPLMVADSPTQRSSAAWILGFCSSGAFFTCCDTADGFFFSIFLQSFIWLEDFTRRRKRGAGDEGGPALLSCRRRGRREGQGTGGGEGREGQQLRRPWALAAWGPNPRYVYSSIRLKRPR